MRREEWLTDGASKLPEVEYRRDAFVVPRPCGGTPSPVDALLHGRALPYLGSVAPPLTTAAAAASGADGDSSSSGGAGGADSASVGGLLSPHLAQPKVARNPDDGTPNLKLPFVTVEHLLEAIPDDLGDDEDEDEDVEDG